MNSVMKKYLFALPCSLLSFYFIAAQHNNSQTLAQPDATQYVAIPDYVGQQVRVIATDGNQSQLRFLTPDCNPNSVAYNRDRLYVACNKDWNNGDKILVYQFQELAAAKPQGTKVSPSQAISSSEFDGLMAMSFDSQNALWISSYHNHQIVRLSASTLSSAHPKVDKKLIHSPDNPVGIVFDKQDGSLWVTGQYQGGIVINIPKSELDKPSDNVNGISVVDAIPTYCISNNIPDCKQSPELFDNPEGIALFDQKIWISNNGGNHPAASLVRLSPKQGQSTRFGGGAGNPFSCPGGLASDGSRLWINDQSLGKTDTTCGQNDSQSNVDGVLVYNSSAFSNPNDIGSPSASLKGVTSRPGLGGITVFSNSIQF